MNKIVEAMDAATGYVKNETSASKSKNDQTISTSTVSDTVSTSSVSSNFRDEILRASRPAFSTEQIGKMFEWVKGPLIEKKTDYCLAQIKETLLREAKANLTSKVSWEGHRGAGEAFEPNSLRPVLAWKTYNGYTCSIKTDLYDIPAMLAVPGAEKIAKDHGFIWGFGDGDGNKPLNMINLTYDKNIEKGLFQKERYEVTYAGYWFARYFELLKKKCSREGIKVELFNEKSGRTMSDISVGTELQRTKVSKVGGIIGTDFVYLRASVNFD